MDIFDFEKKSKASEAILDKNEDRKQIALSNNKLARTSELSPGSFKGRWL